MSEYHSFFKDTTVGILLAAPRFWVWLVAMAEVVVFMSTIGWRIL